MTSWSKVVAALGSASSGSRFLPTQELKQLADEIRAETIFTVSKTGGHLGSSLGVVELTIALHHVFNTPEDRIIWDVGHQVGLLLMARHGCAMLTC